MARLGSVLLGFAFKLSIILFIQIELIQHYDPNKPPMGSETKKLLNIRLMSFVCHGRGKYVSTVYR